MDIFWKGIAVSFMAVVILLTLDQYMQEFREAEDRAAAADRLCEYFLRTAPIAPICFRNFVVLTHTDVVEGLVTAPGNTFSALDQWTIHLGS